MKRGLVLEGGAMRGLFSAGICDVMMEHDIWPDGLIGVSAGAAFGCNYKSRQIGRAIRYNMRFSKDSRYSGLRSLLTTGNYFNGEFAYHIVPEKYDFFDDDAFEKNPMDFIVVCTNVETGKAIYKKLKTCNRDTYDWIRASASMPIVSRIVELEGYKLLDGGVADSIPLEYAETSGYQKNLVILTQPEGYQKEHNKLMPIIRMTLRKYPNMIKALDERHIMYNRQLEYIKKAEAEHRCMVIRPNTIIPIGHISHSPEQMRKVYEMGREAGIKNIKQIKDYYK